MKNAENAEKEVFCLQLVIQRGADKQGNVRYGFAILLGAQKVGESGPRYESAEKASEAGRRAHEDVSQFFASLSQVEEMVRVQHDVPEGF